MFGQMFQLENAINCYIPSGNYMPVGFGQLGCSGFIVVDKKGNFVSRKTRAYLQYGEGAFEHVEELLSDLLKEEPTSTKSQANARDASPFSAGSTAIIDGMGKFDGVHVTIAHFDPSSGCFSVKLHGSGKSLLVQPCSLRPLDEPISSKEATSEESDAEKDVLTGNAKVKALAPPSVGVESMDQEHAECARAFQELLDMPTSGNLEKVIGLLEEHFDHEEKLMKQHGFGNGDGKGFSTFSALDSHSYDHQRILSIGRDELLRITKVPSISCEGTIS